MKNMKASTLVPLLLLAVGMSCAQPLQGGSLAAVAHSVNEVVFPFLTDPWPTDLQFGDAQLKRPDEDSPEVTVDDLGATFRGTTTWSLNNRTINSFLGIKFATFDGRFKHSTVASQGDYIVEDVVRADHYGPKCCQKSGFGNFAGGEEQCLFLNVYVPADLQAGGNLPVMVFIHGGSFTGGDSSLYLPTRLLDEDVILVVIQYRLGALGWLSLLNDDIPGNAGLSDQLNALRWVQKYIAAFGGNPEQVTVFGQSAGSVSVSLIVTVADPEEKLFARAIAESGSALEYWAIDEHPIQSAIEFAELCGCEDFSNEAAVYNCLSNQKTAEEIAVCTSLSVSKQRRDAKLGFDGTSPVVQGDSDQPWALIKQAPIDYVEQGLANDVPFLSGCVRDEGSFVFAVITDSYLRPNGLQNDPDYLANNAIPDLLSAAGIEDSTRAFSKALQDKFLPGVNISSYDAIAPGMVDMSGMLFLKSGTYNYAKLHSQHYTSDIYYYSFDFESQNSLFDLAYIGREEPFDGGITHADELMYLFAIPSAMDDSQRLTSQRMVKLWTNFAKNGNPTPDGEDKDLGLPAWTPLTKDGQNYLLIQDKVTVEMYYPDRYTIRMDMLAASESTSTPEPTEEPGTALTQKPTEEPGTALTQKPTEEPGTALTQKPTEEPGTALTQKPTEEPGTASTPKPTEDPGTTSLSSETPHNSVSQEAYDDLKKQSDAYMACMIVFIVLFAISTGAAVFLYLKTS